MTHNALALGTFDGLHLGHQKVLAAAAEGGCHPIAVLFKTSPRALKAGLENNQLMLPEKKQQLLQVMGVETCFLDFFEICTMPPETFLSWLVEQFHPCRLVCGFNYRFGFQAAGDTSLLQKFCAKNGIECTIVQEVTVEGEQVSSTKIRQLLTEGNIQKVNALLGRDFSFSGTVQHGAARGRRLGFPTLNIYYPTGMVFPAFGVYAGTAVVQGKQYFAVTNLGHRPTFKSQKVISETYLFHYSQNAYEQQVEISLKYYLRPEQKFSNEQELRVVVEKDKQTAFQLLTHSN